MASRAMTNIERYNNYFNDGDYFIYECIRCNYILQIINVNIESEDMTIQTVPTTPRFHNTVFTKYITDIPAVYKVIELYR